MRTQCTRCKSKMNVSEDIALDVLRVGKIICSHCGGLIELKTDEQIKERTDWKAKMVVKEQTPPPRA